MPIFSAVKNLSLPLDDSFRPATEINFVDAPPYAFHFTTNTDYDTHQGFTFDDCNEYRLEADNVSCTWTNPDDKSTQDAHLNEHNLHYRRLFVLKYRGNNPAQYYLTPWLGVPYEKDNANTSTPAQSKFTLRVRAFSIYEDTVNRGVRKRIKTGGATRPLKLKTSNQNITAKWITPTPSDTIFEDKLKKDSGQKIEIAIATAAHPQGYLDQEHVEITDALGRTLGKLYLLFLEMVPHQVIFFKVTKVEPPVQNPSLNPTKLNVSMIPIDTTLTYERDLNALYLRTGIKHTWVNTVLQYTDGSTLKSMGLPATTTVPQAIEIAAAPGTSFEGTATTLDEKVLRTLSDNFVEKMDPTVRNRYLLVFFAPFVAETVKDTLGISYGSSRTSCIYTHSSHTLCHEASHALGLPHYFFANIYNAPAADKELPGRIVTTGAAAVARFNDVQIHSKKDFYQFHDTMNKSDSSREFSERVSSSHGSAWSHTAFIKFYVNYFTAYQTHNLMDYPGTNPRTMERLTKYQIERLRFAINNRIYGDVVL